MDSDESKKTEGGTESAAGPQGDKGQASATSRRDFLSRAGNATIGLCAVGAAALGTRVAVPDFSDGPPEVFPVGSVADFKIGTLTWIRDKDLFVTRDNSGIGVFSSRCTHLGCTVRRTAEGFFCPCHGAKYAGDGKVTAGPARKDLPWYRVWTGSDGRVWVDTSSNVERGAMAPTTRNLPGAQDEDP